MKILHIISSNGIYGAESVLLNLLEKLQANPAHEVQLICLRSKGKDEPDIYFEAQKRNINAQVHFCKSKIDKEVMEKMIDLVKNEQFELIHTHGYKSNFYGLKVAQKTHVPIVATLHGWTGENLKIKLYDVVDKMNIKKMNFAICVSPKIEKEMLKSRMAKEKVGIVLNGVDTNKFHNDSINGSLRGELGLQGPVVIGCVGRLSAEKGHKYLLNAFVEIREVYDDAKLLIVGDGDLKKDLENQVNKMNLEGAVIFAGEQENMPEVYNCMDIFVLPSLTEGIPIALLEAMSMELPVVATKVGGIPFIIEHEEGKLVDKESPRALAEAVSLLLEKKKLRRDMGQAARRRIVDRFSVDQMVNNYEKIYQKVKA